MTRRDLILLGIVAGFWPLGVPAQPSKRPTVGLLIAGTHSSHGRWVDAFVYRLGELGWTEGRTVDIEYRWAEGKTERGAEFAGEFVRRKVDVIVTSGTAMVRATKQATSLIPIIFAAAGDPVGTGLVASLAEPGGNVTGFSIQQTDAAPKRLQLLREAVPGLRRLVILGNVGGPAVLLDMREVEIAASQIGLKAVILEIRRDEDIAPAFETIKERAEALYIVNDPLIDTHRVQISALALAGHLPTMYASREHVEAGGLMSYGTELIDLFRRSADLVNKVLNGAKPADLPVEQPTKFELVINAHTAKALGLQIPVSILARADHVIE